MENFIKNIPCNNPNIAFAYALDFLCSFLVCKVQSTTNAQWVCANVAETPCIKLLKWNLNLSSLIEFEFLWLTWNPAAVFISLRAPCKCQIEIAIISKFE